jgi:hypothetical protein
MNEQARLQVCELFTIVLYYRAAHRVAYFLLIKESKQTMKRDHIFCALFIINSHSHLLVAASEYLLRLALRHLDLRFSNI